MVKTYGIGALSGLMAVLVIQIMPQKWVQETAGILVGLGVSFGVSSMMELRSKLEELTALRIRLLDDQIKTDLEKWFG